jgi:hypothetical protein
MDDSPENPGAGTDEQLEDSMKNLADKTLSSPKAGKADSSMRISFRNWRTWAIAGGGGLATVLALVIFTISMSRYENHREEMMLSRSSGLAALDDRRVASVESKHSFAPPPSESNGLAVGVVMNAPAPAAPAPTPAPMIARTVSLTIVVKDFAAARTSLDNILARHHGYTAQLTVSTPENAARSFQASLRVPAPELSLALGDFKSLGRVENESQSGEEVTQQHTDLVERLKTARVTEERFRAILQQRTGKVGEVLQVEEQIARVRGEIESMEVELKALEHRVDFATVDLELTEEYSARLSSPSASNRMHNAFIAGLSNAAATLLGIVLFLEEYGPALLIWLVILGTPVYFVWRRYRRMRSKV